MRRFGTDLLALGCILGGAVLGGAATFAVLEAAPHPQLRCAVEAATIPHGIVVTHGEEAHTIVVTPDVRVRGVGDCLSEVDEIVEIRLDRELRHLDAELKKLDVVLEQELGGLDRELELRMLEMEKELELTLERELQAQGRLEEAKQKLEEARIRVLVKGERGGSL